MTGNQRYRKYLVVAAVFSLLLHVLVTKVLNHVRDAQPMVNNLNHPVVIRIVSQPKPAPVLAKKRAEPKETAKKTPIAPVETEETEEPKKVDNPEPSYPDFFPAPSWPSGTIVTGKPATDVPATVETQKLSGHLSGALDIPLVFRENSGSSKAVAKFRKNSNGDWHFEYIDGEPVLRAVLYQAFLKPDNLQKIDELAAELKMTEIIFTIQQTTKLALDGWKQFSDSISYAGNRIIFARTIYTGSDGSSGMQLPDEEAKRAVLRDNVALKRLMNSPAYYSPIRNRKIVIE